MKEEHTQIPQIWCEPQFWENFLILPVSPRYMHNNFPPLQVYTLTSLSFFPNETPFAQKTNAKIIAPRAGRPLSNGHKNATVSRPETRDETCTSICACITRRDQPEKHARGRLGKHTARHTRELAPGAWVAAACTERRRWIIRPRELNEAARTMRAGSWAFFFSQFDGTQFGGRCGTWPLRVLPPRFLLYSTLQEGRCIGLSFRGIKGVMICGRRLRCESGSFSSRWGWMADGAWIIGFKRKD